MAKQPFTQQYLKSLLDYDPETGIFVWKERHRKNSDKRWNGSFAGKIAGRENTYWEISIDYRRHGAHRIAWLYIYGEWPPEEVDHINGIKTDNRINNLRLANHSQNMHNTVARRTSKFGIKGVCIYKKGNWIRYYARIRINGTDKSLGYYKTIEEAAKAYKAAAQKHHGEFFNNYDDVSPKLK